MKKIILSAILATSMAASAFAISTSELVIGFRDVGTDGGTNTTQDLQIDLGAISTFKNTSLYASGVTTVVTNLLSLGSNSINTVFTGTTWSSNSGLSWGIAGTNGSTVATRTLWGTSVANSSLLNGSASTTAGLVGSSSQQATGASKISSVYSNQGANTVFVDSVANGNSWAAQLTSASPIPFGWGGFDVLTTFENNTEIGGSGYVASDLYEFVPFAGSPKPAAVYLGTFAIWANGDVTFTAAAIPEPSTYAAILGVATVGFVMLRRRKLATA